MINRRIDSLMIMIKVDNKEIRRVNKEIRRIDKILIRVSNSISRSYLMIYHIEWDVWVHLWVYLVILDTIV